MGISIFSFLKYPFISTLKNEPNSLKKPHFRSNLNFALNFSLSKKKFPTFVLIPIYPLIQILPLLSSRLSTLELVRNSILSELASSSRPVKGHI